MKKQILYFLTALAAVALVDTLVGDRLSAQSDSADSADIIDSTLAPDTIDIEDSANRSADSLEAVTVGDTLTTKSGLSYVITKAGEGPIAKNGQDISVHFVGRIAESGEEFYNSYKETGPLSFALGRGKVIKGCDEGITGMAVGEERTLFIPWALGYGERGHPGAKIPPETDLIFDVALVSIKKGK